MSPTSYNYTEAGRVYSFDDVFLHKDYFSEGSLCTWGYNEFGQIGDNTNSPAPFTGSNIRSTPRQEFTNSNNWKQVSFGEYTASAIKSDGTLWSWGYNGYGQIGDNSIVNKTTVRQESTSSTNWKQISRGASFSAAIKTDGTLWLWGRNDYGQLGDNTTASRSTPRQEFTSSTNWKQVTAGGFHCLAIKSDGSLWGWGYNEFGTVGDNTSSSVTPPNRSTPTQVGTATNWKQVGAGRIHSLGIKTDGTLWGWGRNVSGPVGDNTNAHRSTPRQVGAETNWKYVATTIGHHSAAIKTDGTLWCWGYNSHGQIGDNTAATSIGRSTPRQEFTSSTNWKQVSGGYDHTLAIKTNGTLWVWGRNNLGQIGDNSADNTNFERSTPRQEFTSSTNWKQVDGGTYNSIAVKSVDISFY
jgi:alpha-tubulin suppressor-like RCC1 family protein